MCLSFEGSPCEKRHWVRRDNMADGTRPSTMLSRVAGPGSSEVIHSLDPLSLIGIQTVVGHAFGAAHECHVDCSVLVNI